MLAQYSLSSAIYERLTSGNSRIPYCYYQEAPGDVDYPYVCLGSMIGQDDSTKGINGQRITVTFDGWDSVGPMGGTDERLIQMMSAVMDSITVTNSANYNPLRIDYFNISYVECSQVQLVSSIDQALRHASMNFTFEVSEI